MFVYFNFLNYDESLFYTLIKVTIHYLIKITQRTKIKLIINIVKILYLLNFNISCMVIKKIHGNYIKFLYYSK